MNSFLATGALAMVLAFCGIGDRLKQMSGGDTGGGASNSSGTGTGTSKGSSAEKPSLTAAQQSIQDSSTEVKWDDQGISFKVPSGFSKMQVLKESFSYGSPAAGFLNGSISVMPSSFPSETSLDATYSQGIEMMKQGKYESVRWLEIDGVKGVEWVEAMPEIKDGARRHQWIAFRNFQGQNQQLNIMVSTDGDKFEPKRDTFAAIMYSMKIAKG